MVFFFVSNICRDKSSGTVELLEIRFSGTAITIGSTAVYLSHGSKVYLYITLVSFSSFIIVFYMKLSSLLVSTFIKNVSKSCITYHLLVDFLGWGSGINF